MVNVPSTMKFRRELFLLRTFGKGVSRRISVNWITREGSGVVGDGGGPT